MQLMFPVVGSESSNKHNNHWTKLKKQLLPHKVWWSTIARPGEDTRMMLPAARANRSVRSEAFGQGSSRLHLQHASSEEEAVKRTERTVHLDALNNVRVAAPRQMLHG